jgi:phospholipid/cholesterol/gamma-HCH transport system substrate-binding protein
LVSNFSDYSSKLTAKGSLANDLITDTVIFAHLRSTVREIVALSNKASDVVANLSQTSQNINQKLNDNTNPAGLLLNDKETTIDIKATIKSLQAASAKLDENMEALQHNFLLRGFFKKREKEKAK